MKEFLRANPAWPWVLLFLLLSSIGTELGGTNAISRVAALRAMAEGGSLHIDHYKEWSNDWSLSPNGHYYSNKAPGSALFGFPVFALIDYPVRALAPSGDEQRRAPPPELWELWLLCLVMQLIPFSLLVLYLARYLEEQGAPPPAVHFFAVAALFGNTAGLYMGTYFGHGLASIFFLASFLFWLRRRYLVCAFFAGASLLTDYGTAALLPFLGIATLFRERQIKPVLPLALGALPMAAIFAWYHQTAFGSPFSLATFYSNPEMLVTIEGEAGSKIHSLLPSWKAVFGLLLSTERGLLFTQPWILGLFLLPFRKEEKPVKGSSLFLAGGLFALIWLTAGTPAWHGGHSIGPRYLSVVFPATALLLALQWKSLAERSRLFLAAGLGVSVVFYLLAFPFTVLPPIENLWSLHFRPLSQVPWIAPAFLRFLLALSAFTLCALWVRKREASFSVSLKLPPYFFAALALTLSLLIHLPLLGKAEPLGRDDLALLTPLMNLAGPFEWASAWRQGKIFDLGPVRDLSYLIDLKIGAFLGFPVFHITQLALWILFLFLASAFLALATSGFLPASAWMLFLSVQPVFASSVAWISARKHLLAAIFCLGASLLLLKGKGDRFRVRIALLYVLSVLSHPIYLLWPVWAAIWSWANSGETIGKVIRLLLPTAICMPVLAAANYWYYTQLFPLASGGLGKFSSPEDSGPGIALLSLGRSFFNLVAPISISPVDYYPGAWENLAGIALLAFFLFASWKFLGRKTLFVWGAFFALPLLMLNLRSTRVFLSDTYLLLPSLGIWVLSASLLKRRAGNLPGRWRPVIAALVLAFGGCALLSSRGIASSFLNEERLFSLAYVKEATPQVRLVHAGHLLERGALKEAALLAAAEKGRQPMAAVIFAQAILLDPSLNPVLKVKILLEEQDPQPLYQFYLAKALAAAGDCRRAYLQLSPLLNTPSGFGPKAGEAAELALRCARESGIDTRKLERVLNYPSSKGKE